MDYGRPSFVWPSLTPGVKRLLLINGAVFVLNMIVVGITRDPMAMARWFGVSWPQVTEFWGLGVLRLVTYQFVHSFVSVGHILFNMLALYFFGTMVEGTIGARRLYALYLAAGVAGAVVDMVLQTMLHVKPVIGASGACYGILVYAACMAPHANVILIFVTVPLRVVAWLLIGIGAYMTYVNLVLGPTDTVAHGAHLGGALWGWLAYRYRLRPERLVEDLLARQRGRRQKRQLQARARDQAVLDELLEKVHKEGMRALTPAERRFLDRASKHLRNR